MKEEELEVLKPGTEVYILFGCHPLDWYKADKRIEKCIFEGLHKPPRSKYVLLRVSDRRSLWYLDRVFLTKEDAEIARISFLLSGND